LYTDLPSGGVREASLEFVSAPVQTPECRISPRENGDYHHVYFALQYTPRALGVQTATVTVYHDGNEAGFSTFTISGEAFWDASAAARPTALALARTGLNGAVQEGELFMRAAGTFGTITYTGFKVEGSPDIYVTSVGRRNKGSTSGSTHFS